MNTENLNPCPLERPVGRRTRTERATVTTAFKNGLKQYYAVRRDIFDNPYKSKKRITEWREGWLYAFRSSTKMIYE